MLSRVYGCAAYHATLTEHREDANKGVVRLRSNTFGKASRCITVGLVLTIAAAVALSGCGSSTTTQKKTQGTTTSMNVKSGQDFTVSLQSNPTTGYQWQLAQPLNPKVLKKVGSVYQASQAGTVGAGGVEIWTFKAVGKGKDDIKMQYVRPGDKSAKPTEERVFSVTVQ
jgi:inhibitor of cysteine peptidase